MHVIVRTIELNGKQDPDGRRQPSPVSGWDHRAQRFTADYAALTLAKTSLPLLS
jgi:hypothetical protein